MCYKSKLCFAAPAFFDCVHRRWWTCGSCLRQSFCSCGMSMAIRGMPSLPTSLAAQCLRASKLARYWESHLRISCRMLLYFASGYARGPVMALVYGFAFILRSFKSLASQDLLCALSLNL